MLSLLHWPLLFGGSIAEKTKSLPLPRSMCTPTSYNPPNPSLKPLRVPTLTGIRLAMAVRIRANNDGGSVRAKKLKRCRLERAHHDNVPSKSMIRMPRPRSSPRCSPRFGDRCRFMDRLGDRRGPPAPVPWANRKYGLSQRRCAPARSATRPRRLLRASGHWAQLYAFQLHRRAALIEGGSW